MEFQNIDFWISLVAGLFGVIVFVIWLKRGGRKSG